MSVFFVLFLLGIATMAFSEQCPPSDDLRPCICDHLSNGGIKVRCFSFFSNDKVTLQDLRKAFKSLQGKTVHEMLLFDNSLGNLPSDLFKGMSVNELHIEYSRLESLTDGDNPIFAGLEDSLELLRIKDSLVKNADLSKLKFGHLKKLKDLTFYENSFKEASNSWFEDGPASLEIVDLIFDNIEELGDKIFANLPNLTRISLAGNKIRSVKRGMFPKPALHLKDLYLFKNPIENLPEDIFSDMPALSSLGIEIEGVSHLDEATWKPVWEQLKYLDIFGMDLECDSRLEWIIELKAPKTLFGYCYDSEKSDVVEILDFIKEKKKKNY